MINVAALWRHPIKSHGREEIKTVTLVAGQTMPWDRHWAVTHNASKINANNPAWVICRNFMIGASTPGLAGIWAELDTETATVTLRHDMLGHFTFRPDDAADLAGFLAWVLPLCPADKYQPAGIAKVAGRGMTDTDYPSISIMTQASHKAAEDHLGAPLEQARWRGNIWLDGADAWEEMYWVGRSLRIGDAEFAVRGPIKRCMATAANPHTGLRDTDILGTLRSGWDHQNFGIYATVTKGGKITTNDNVEVI